MQPNMPTPGPSTPMPPQGGGMPPGISISNIRQALQGRMGAGIPPIPGAASAMTALPTGAMPNGMPGTPIPAAPAMPLPNTPPVENALPPRGGATPQQALAGAGQQAQGPQFDDETRAIAKALVTKLIKHI